MFIHRASHTRSVATYCTSRHLSESQNYRIYLIAGRARIDTIVRVTGTRLASIGILGIIQIVKVVDAAITGTPGHMGQARALASLLVAHGIGGAATVTQTWNTLAVLLVVAIGALDAVRRGPVVQALFTDTGGGVTSIRVTGVDSAVALASLA